MDISTHETSSRCWVVIPAAGIGQRMGANFPKQFLQVEGRSLLRHTLDIFLNHPRINGITVALSQGWEDYCTDLPDLPDYLQMAPGGKERSESVLNALKALRARVEPRDWIIVHDAARPCLPREDLDRLLDSLEGEPVGGLLASPSTDTLKWVDEQGRQVVRTLDRSRVWRAMTPQMFRYDLLHQALVHARVQAIPVTDEASALEAMGFSPRLIEGSAVNLKVTRPEDLEMVRSCIIQRQQMQEKI